MTPPGDRFAYDYVSFQVTVEYDLRVVGIQDTPPRFDNTPISYSILENEPAVSYHSYIAPTYPSCDTASRNIVNV